MTTQGERYAATLRRIQPDRLVGWAGFAVAGVMVNPYVHYGDARYRKEPREVLICDLLIGDLVAEALLHPSVRVVDKRTSPAPTAT